LRTNQIPYCVAFTYSRVSGTRTRLVAILPPLINIDPKIFFLAFTVRPCPWLNFWVRDKINLFIKEIKIIYKWIPRNYKNQQASRAAIIPDGTSGINLLLLISIPIGISIITRPYLGIV